MNPFRKESLSGFKTSTKEKRLMEDIDLDDYDYELPAERIAQYPARERDDSQLLISEGSRISKDIFKNLVDYLPLDSLLVFNNTRVIRARILFRKDTGSSIEILCLEPLLPSEYELSFSSLEPVEWKCIIGNLKKWKTGILKTPFINNKNQFSLSAEKIQPEGEACRIRFSWDCLELSFGEVIEAAGHIPLPPYIDREDETVDISRYQTVYSSIKGSVAAPTAGLHFTPATFKKLKEKGIKGTEVTLHVGAGTFQPIKSKDISGHEMHCEHFFVTAETIRLLIENQGRIIPVGTTSIRTLESLYWLGIKLLLNPSLDISDISLGQWEAYDINISIPATKSLEALLKHLQEQNLHYLHASTSIIIIPGYNFRLINGMITNFHQPRSTLLLLISAWAGKNWKNIYRFALENNFRFLSYGDCSLLLRNQQNFL
jgi:S-adenosylmethionine:tRNA ribosyltransferase-isomerase